MRRMHQIETRTLRIAAVTDAITMRACERIPATISPRVATGLPAPFVTVIVSYPPFPLVEWIAKKSNETSENKPFAALR